MMRGFMKNGSCQRVVGSSQNGIKATQLHTSRGAIQAGFSLSVRSFSSSTGGEKLYEVDYTPYTPRTDDPGTMFKRFDWRKWIRSSKKEQDETRNSFPYVSRRNLQLSNSPTPEYARAIDTYRKRFVPLIDAEQVEQENAIKNRLETWNLSRLKSEGYCLTGMHAFWLGKTNLGRPIARFRSDLEEFPSNHSFSKGTSVMISRISPLKEVPVIGNIVASDAEQIDVSFEQSVDVDNGLWRMDIGYSDIVFERMKKAINDLEQDPQVIEMHPENSDKRQYLLKGTYLRDVLLKSFSEYDGASEIVEQGPHHLQDPSDPAYLSHDQLEHPSKLLSDENESNGLFSDDMYIHSWAERYKHREPVVIEGDPDLNGLNQAQVRAVATMISERISLIQGPPGTGKTRTIVEAVKLLKKHFGVTFPIVVCTYTNAAADNLLDGFISSGVKAIRVGFEGKAKPALEEYLIESQFDKQALKPEFDKVGEEMKKTAEDVRILEDELLKLGDSIKTLTPSLKGRIRNMKKRLQSLKARENMFKIRQHVVRERIFRDLLTKADVICTTCIRSATSKLNAIDFPVVFLDEASMSTEPVTLIPLMKGCKHLALIGDHKQLPPVVISPQAQEGGLSISLFERLTEEGEVPSVMLDTQYRMHPGISSFPSSEFYNFCLLDGTVNSTGQVLPKLLPPASSHLIMDPATGHRPSVIFIDHEGPEAIKLRSRVNWTEAYIVCSIIEDLLLQNTDLSGEDIGVIAPYKSQMSLLTRLLNKDDNMKRHLQSVLGKERFQEVENIEIKTVDGFEGREKDAIIFSTVRNNPEGAIGFLADRRRLNVGLTRAKRALFVIGNMSTLQKGKFGRRSASELSLEMEKISKGAVAWRNYARYLTERNLILRLRGEDLVKVLRAQPTAVRL